MVNKLELQNRLDTIQNFLNKQVGKELIYNVNKLPSNNKFGRPGNTYAIAKVLDGFVFYNRRKGKIIIWVLYMGSYASSHMFNHILKTYLNCTNSYYFDRDNKNELEQYEKMNKFNGPHRQHSKNWFKKKY